MISKHFSIYLKSFVDYIFLRLLRVLFVNRSKRGNNLLFINTGQIGDLVISSLLLKNDYLFSEYENVFFLVQNRFKELFNDYQGRITIIEIDINSYKYNFFYRYKFNRNLKGLRIDTVYNLTSIRPTWNDTLAVGISANKSFCYENTWNSLIKIFPKTTEAYYTRKIAKGIFNEYERINFLINFFGQHGKTQKIIQTKVFNKNSININSDVDVIINPFSSDKNRSLSLELVNQLVEKFKNYRFLILCSREQRELLKNLKFANNIEIAAGKYKLNQLFGVINNSKIFLGLDSGLTHIALLTKTNVIVIIGKGNYGRYLPKPGDEKTIYLYEECELAGCEWYCKKEDIICVKEVPEIKIVEAMNELL